MAKKMNRTLSDELRDIARGVEAGDCTTTAKELRGLADRIGASPWRPISEAPYNGALVDVWNGRRIVDASWLDDPALMGWVTGPDHCGAFHYLSPQPTHFMMPPVGPK